MEVSPFPLLLLAKAVSGTKEAISSWELFDQQYWRKLDRPLTPVYQGWGQDLRRAALLAPLLCVINRKSVFFHPHERSVG